MSNIKSFGTVTAQIQKELAEDLIKTLKEALENPAPQYEIFMDIPYRKPLTNQELEKMWDEDVSSNMPDTFTQFKHIVRAVEAAHGIK